MITLEGNIGAGKSTILSYLANLEWFQKAGYMVDQEPVDEWEHEDEANGGKNLLKSFYENPTEYAYLFQMYVLQTRSKHLMEKMKLETENNIIVSERSIFTDAEIFAKNGYKNGTICPHEMFVYTEWHKMMENIIHPNIRGLIYIRVSPRVCYERINKRARGGEEKITLDYLEQLHKRHEEWLLGTQDDNGNKNTKGKNKKDDVPILVIDYDEGNTEDALARIKAFLSR